MRCDSYPSGRLPRSEGDAGNLLACEGIAAAALCNGKPPRAAFGRHLPRQLFFYLHFSFSNFFQTKSHILRSFRLESNPFTVLFIHVSCVDRTVLVSNNPTLFHLKTTSRAKKKRKSLRQIGHIAATPISKYNVSPPRFTPIARPYTLPLKIPPRPHTIG